jgi:hypothetical protein
MPVLDSLAPVTPSAMVATREGNWTASSSVFRLWMSSHPLKIPGNSLVNPPKPSKIANPQEGRGWNNSQSVSRRIAAIS